MTIISTIVGKNPFRKYGVAIIVNKSPKCSAWIQFQKQQAVVYVTGDGSKVQSCKEHCCIGTCNVRSMNQGKLEVVRQEMARVNIDILGISEQKWTEMGEFNSDASISTTAGKNPLVEME